MATNHISDYPQLQSIISGNQRLVYLFGAGASMSLGCHKLSWTSWILEGKKFLSPLEQNELESKIGVWSTDELIDAATYLLCQLKEIGCYQDFMNQTIGMIHPKNIEFMEALKKLWRTGDLITTTNYDIQIEETLVAKGISYASPAEVLSTIRKKTENRIIHLHGMYDPLHGMNDIIADGQQYQDILENEGAQFIQNLISTYPLIIVGCGGTVEDPNLSGFMSFIVKKLGVTDTPYFYLLKNGETIPDLPTNAIPIFYGDDYSDLPVFLLELAGLRLQYRAELRNIVSVSPYQERRVSTSAFGRMHFSNRFNLFVGRTLELDALNSFLGPDDKFLWWTILGEGGIGKSRLVLEWLKKMPYNWYGFFSKKNADGAKQFQPFNDTVIVFDYVLGYEKNISETIEEFLRIFEDSPYKLRIILLERNQKTTYDDWLIMLKNSFSADIRLMFDLGEYEKQPLVLGALSISDEKDYIENYLKVYLPLLSESDFITSCQNNNELTIQNIQSNYRNSVNEVCLRPLFLSIFIEIWLSKNGHVDSVSTEDLLYEYLIKERKRWEIIFGNEALTDSYLRVLAMACAIGHLNITDMYGSNYLENDCKKLIAFFDTKSMRPNSDNVFENLFVSIDERVDVPEEETDEESFFESFYNVLHKEDGELEEDIPFIGLEQDEKFAMLAPFIKIDADPEEVYLQMLVSSDYATEEEIDKLTKIREERIQKEKELPDHAWILEPVFPDIINSYIVSYTVNERDAKRFARLARSNSVLELSSFLTHALEDWPKNEVIQKIAVTPPDETLNFAEYYLGLSASASFINDLATVEKALINSEPIFLRYEIELWRRIAIVLPHSKPTIMLKRSHKSCLKVASA